jgi:murein DD-endopeptidase MepM/ murein hydrolase activator NlpD
VEKDIRYFPIPLSEADDSLGTSYVDSWMGERDYKGKGVHEGTDIMADRDERGIYPVVSISDGTITNLGWLEKGGYRIGITSPSGVYFYYAHLESYADIKEGDFVMAGQFLGFMGDSGYGEEGTTGQFPVHLHLGIYSFEEGEEISVNPYYVLLALEDKKLKYYYI